MTVADSTWREEVFPNDLGDGEHRWSWLMVTPHSGSAVINDQRKNLLWLHRCVDKRWSVSWIDLTSGTHHVLLSDDPLTIEPSVLCPAGCGDHGYIRGGVWEAA